MSRNQTFNSYYLENELQRNRNGMNERDIKR
jgi:hypothetical protein